MQGVGGAAAGGGGYRGVPYKKKMGSKFIFNFFTAIQRPEGLSRWLKATSPPQELEVGARRAPYLLVLIYHTLIQPYLYFI